MTFGHTVLMVIRRCQGGEVRGIPRIQRQCMSQHRRANEQIGKGPGRWLCWFR